MLPVAHKVLEDVKPSTYFTIPTEKAVHLRIDATTMQFMKSIHEVDTDTSTSSWMQNGGPKTFPLDHTPSKVTYGGPGGFMENRQNATDCDRTFFAFA